MNKNTRKLLIVSILTMLTIFVLTVIVKHTQPETIPEKTELMTEFTTVSAAATSILMSTTSRTVITTPTTTVETTIHGTTVTTTVSVEELTEMLQTLEQTMQEIVPPETEAPSEPEPEPEPQPEPEPAPEPEPEPEPQPEPEPEPDLSQYERHWITTNMTYYSAHWGASGFYERTLIDNYSCASNSIPGGTIVWIKSSDGSINGKYRVDDTGGMGDSTIDIFFSSYANVPWPFSRDGRVPVEVYILGHMDDEDQQ